MRTWLPSTRLQLGRRTSSSGRAAMTKTNVVSPRSARNRVSSSSESSSARWASSMTYSMGRWRASSSRNRHSTARDNSACCSGRMASDCTSGLPAGVKPMKAPSRPAISETRRSPKTDCSSSRNRRKRRLLVHLGGDADAGAQQVAEHAARFAFGAIARGGHEDAAKISPLAHVLQPLREEARFANPRAADEGHELRSFEAQRPVKRRSQTAPLCLAPDQPFNSEVPISRSVSPASYPLIRWFSLESQKLDHLRPSATQAAHAISRCLRRPTCR
jgi:hypothetical protein